MTKAEAFAEAVAQRASSALSTSGLQERHFYIGNLPVTLVGNAVMQDILGRAFLSAPELPPNLLTGHRLVAWDGTAPSALPPEPPWQAPDYTAFGVVERYSNEAIRFAFDVETSSLITCDFVDDASYIWLPSIAQLPEWATAAPFRIVLSWLCNRHHMQIVHGAAVAIEGKAALLAGKGGLGKSTTALACALAGWTYLGDDYCAVEPAAGKVHMVYRTAKVTISTLRMLPSLADWTVNQEEPGAEKCVIFLQTDDVVLARSAELSAILLPHQSGERSTKIYPATRAEAIKAILPNTVMQLMGGTSVTPRLIMELAHSLPAFHLALGTDLSSLTDTIASWLLQEV